jgi:hypothetical protein
MVFNVIGATMHAHLHPMLTLQDVQNVLIRTAKMNHASDPGWANNSAGLHINHKVHFLSATARVNALVGAQLLGQADGHTLHTCTVWVWIVRRGSSNGPGRHRQHPAPLLRDAT